MKEITYEEILKRIKYFRTLKGMNRTETSYQLGYNHHFMRTIEEQEVELKVKTLLDFCDVVGITLQDFVMLGEKFNANDKNILEKFSKLTDENKRIVLDLMEKLK